jgi:nitrogenase molybdenum-iron protein alpha/beta subunit
MREYYKEHSYSGIYPSRIMHNMGVSGKISGAMNVVSEIKDAVAIIHSPKGCGFHYKYIARRRYLPSYKAQCTNLKEEDIIFGIEKKLKETISETINNYHPKLIVIIPSVCTDIIDVEINKDIKDEFKEETDCKIIFIKSEVFSHIDKSSSKKNNEERILYWDKPEEQKGIGKGCGIDEAMTAFVAQLMEKQKVQDRTVNIESFAWGGNKNLEGIISILSEMGISVNSVMPSCSTEDIIKAPIAKLNIVRRSSWAKNMKKVFGTEYFHVNTFHPYHGLEGIEKFYMNIADYFDISVEASKILSDMKQQVFTEIHETKNYIMKHTFALYSNSVSNLPYMIEALTNDYGVNLKYICINIDYNKLEYEDIDKNIVENTMINIKKVINDTGNNTIIYINSEKEDLKRIFKDVDIVINGTEFLSSFKGLKTIDVGKLFIPIDFNNFKNNVYDFANKVKKARSQENLITSKFTYDDLLYPTIGEMGPTTSEKMWHKMWTLRR